MKLKIALFVALTICGCIQSLAQTDNTNVDISSRPTTEAHFLDKPPTIDGEVLQDADWKQIQAFGDLVQIQPNVGQQATENTEIRIAYTASTLYLAVVCYDEKPEELVVTDARRDASLDDTDAFIFILDTYRDRQNGFVFGTNTLGVEYDAQVDNEGQGNFSANRQQRGMIGGFNLNWDASWEVKTQVGDFGWSAEFAIPFRTLRFRSGEDQVWGINFRRNIRKTNEIDYWASLPLGFNLNRLSMAGTLTGLNLKNPGNLKVIPYVLGQVAKDFEVVEPETKFNPAAGVDLKYSITPSVTLDLTYNTDFAQVEVDDQQINLDRFNLFFPEKRPFFLENAGQFSVGSPGEVDLFFSRRIGIGEDGALVPIIGGARVSGKIKRTNIGVLNMFTDEVLSEGIIKNNFTVARVNQEFSKRSAIGAAFINRQGLGEDEEDNYNRTYALDGKFELGEKAKITGFYAQTATPYIDTATHSFRVQARYTWDGWILSGAYTEVGDGFNPEVGFLQRSSFRKPEFLIFKTIRSKNGKFGFLEIRPHVSYRGYWNFANDFQQTSYLHIDNHWVWKNGMEFHSGINYTSEGVENDFEISDGVIIPSGTYRHKEAQLVFWTNPSKPVSIRLRSNLGGFFGGRRYATSGTLRLRFGDKFNSEFSLIHNDIRLPYGNFIADVFRSRIAYSFTPLIFIQGLIQYNNVSNIWSANMRFGILQRANTGLFVVYNETQGDGLVRNRSFTIKYSRMFDVLK